MFDTVCRPWNDWSAGAQWLQSVWTSPSAWNEAHGGRTNMHGILNLLGVSFFMLVADSLHIMDLGVSHRILGNIFFHMIWEDGFFASSTHEARLGELLVLIQSEYHRTHSPCQLSTLTLNMFSNSGGRTTHQPDLSTRVKAAETRHLIPVMLAIFRQLQRGLNEQDGHIMVILECLDMYYSILAQHKDQVSLPLVAQSNLENALWNINRRYSALGAWALQLGLKRWGATIKFHMALHIALQSRFTNPALTWTYIDEDFMSIVKAVGESCTTATPAHKVVQKLCRRYLTGMDVRLSFSLDLETMD